jgi:hypothetical protein
MLQLTEYELELLYALVDNHDAAELVDGGDDEAGLRATATQAVLGDRVLELLIEEKRGNLKTEIDKRTLKATNFMHDDHEDGEGEED